MRIPGSFELLFGLILEVSTRPDMLQEEPQFLKTKRESHEATATMPGAMAALEDPENAAPVWK